MHVLHGTLHCRVAALADTGIVRTTVTGFGRYRLNSCHGFSNPLQELKLITIMPQLVGDRFEAKQGRRSDGLGLLGGLLPRGPR